MRQAENHEGFEMINAKVYTEDVNFPKAEYRVSDVSVAMEAAKKVIERGWSAKTIDDDARIIAKLEKAAYSMSRYSWMSNNSPAFMVAARAHDWCVLEDYRREMEEGGISVIDRVFNPDLPRDLPEDL
jgi:hypothetical protein